MKNIKIKDYLGNELEGNWNEKFYSSKVEGTKRIYVDNKEVLINDEDVNKIGTTETASKQVIKNYFTKLDMQEREELLTFLSINLKKEHNKEDNLYLNTFDANSVQYLIVEEFKKNDFDNKVKCFTRMKNDYFNQKHLEETGKWHN